MSHLYVTSNHYVDYIKKALGEEHQNKLEELDSKQRQRLIKHASFPVDFKNRQFNSVSQLRAAVTQVVGDNKVINIVVVNGIGNGLGDNYIGLGALQRLTKLLAPSRVHFHLMQELDQRITPVYANQDNVTMHCNVMPVSQFMAMDFYIDLDGIENMPHFDHVPAAHFKAHAFSINQLVPSHNLQALLVTDAQKSNRIRGILSERLERYKRTVLLHPLSSSPLRTLPSQTTAQIVSALVEEGVNVVSLFAHYNPPNGFIDMSAQCKSVDDLVHVVDAVDGVISVGTVVYHLASALSKPTILLPTVMADVRSAELLPEVTTWLPIDSENFIQNLHKSDDPKHLEIANNIWRNIVPIDLAKAIKKHIESFKSSSSGKMLAPSAPERIAVVVLNDGSPSQLTKCLDALVQVNGFDPIRLYTKQVDNALNIDLSKEIQQALKEGCDFIWIINSQTEVASDYLTMTLAQFHQSAGLDCIGDRIIKPKGKTSADITEHDEVIDLDRAVVDDLDTFSSSVLRV